MDDSRTFDDAYEQLDLFERADRKHSIDTEVYARGAVLELLEELAETVEDVKRSDVLGWISSLQNVRADVGLASEELGRRWSEHQAVTVRRMAVGRGSELEQRQRQTLTEELRAQMPREEREQVNSPADHLITRLRWVVTPNERGRGHSIRLRGPWRNADEVTVFDVVDAASKDYGFVSSLSIADALKVGDPELETGRLASEIQALSSLLAQGSPEPQAPADDLPRNYTMVLGPWGSEDAAVQALKKALETQGFNSTDFHDTLQLRKDAARAEGVALDQAIWVVDINHGVMLEGFGNVSSLRETYMASRAGEKPLHVFPAEQAAAQRELEIQPLVREGKLPGHPELLTGTAVLFAREDQLMRNLLVLLAAGKLHWDFSPITESGSWVLDDTSPLPIAEGRDPEVLTARLLALMVAERGDPNVGRITDAMSRVVKAVPYPFPDDVQEKLRGIAADGPADLDLDDGQQLLMRLYAGKMV